MALNQIALEYGECGGSDDDVTIDFEQLPATQAQKCMSTHYFELDETKKGGAEDVEPAATGSTDVPVIGFTLTHQLAQIPKKGTDGSAGFDISPCESKLIRATNKTTFVKTGLQLRIPEGMVGFMVSRSSWRTKAGIGLAGGSGIIDSDFRGNIQIALENTSEKDYLITPSNKIAQILFLPCAQDVMWENGYSIKSSKEIEKKGRAPRGNGGFGSTGF